MKAKLRTRTNKNPPARRAEPPHGVRRPVCQPLVSYSQLKPSRMNEFSEKPSVVSEYRTLPSWV